MHQDAKSRPPPAADKLSTEERRPVALLDAADAAVGEFLSPLPRLLRNAARNSKRSGRPIHRLRVALRQATTMLNAFCPLIANKEFRWMKRRIRCIRIAAGRVRDWDVLRGNLEKQAILDGALRDWIGAQAERHRRAAHKQFLKVLRELDRRKISRRVARIRSRLRWQGQQTVPLFEDWARKVLYRAVTDLLNASQQATYEIESLHRLRITAKRLRYTIALVCSGLDPATAGSLRVAATELQEQLGVLNDRACQIRDLHCLYQEVPSSLKSAFRDFLVMRQIGLESAIEEFHNDWQA
ncbi:MAG: CHAD domain-containing protein [Planctomycetota bacterium]|nr:CHAD domain-containing protein [Planctomycetota bacterium]MDA1177185.1 CHAD domain-containing protein [Planctomycetota bacterium]